MLRIVRKFSKFVILIPAISISGSITVTPSSKSLDTRSQMESYGFPSTSFTPTTNPNNSTSSFKSPSSTNLSSGKSSKGPNPATEYPEEISFLLQRPGEQK